MATFTVHQAKTNLSKLIAQAEAGDEVIIARRNKPAVKLVVADAPRAARVPGAWKDREGFGFDDRFFEPLPDSEVALWEGGGE